MFRVRNLPHGRYRLALTLSFEPRQGRIALAFVVSVLLHVLLFSFGPRKPVTPDYKLPGPLDVTIVDATPAAQPEPPAAAAPAPTPPVPRPTPPQRIARAHPTPAPRISPPVPEPEPVPSPVPAPAPPVDMLAMINAARQRRQQAQRPPGSPGAPASRESAEPNAADRSLAALNRNLKSLGGGEEGVGGVFEILRKGERTGEFAFNGWTPERRKVWREVIEVDAGDRGNIERAMVDRMIDLIRQHYTGDFNWHSQRQGKVVVLSARPEDHAELEEYLMREFFGTPIVKQ